MEPNVTLQPGTTPQAGGSTTPVAPQDPGGTTQQPAAPVAAPAPVTPQDLSKLTGDQLTKVLENPEFWNMPRIKTMLSKVAAAEKLEADNLKANEDKLVADKKFEELATQRGTEAESLKKQIQDMTINQSLTNKLVAEKVIDIDGALKLIDRDKLSVDGNGNVVGADEALASLKTDRAYLFTASGTTTGPTVGTPSNPAPPAGGSTQFKFKESQITPAFYNEHKAELDAAGAAGLIEPDGPPVL